MHIEREKKEKFLCKVVFGFLLSYDVSMYEQEEKSELSFLNNNNNTLNGKQCLGLYVGGHVKH